MNRSLRRAVRRGGKSRISKVAKVGYKGAKYLSLLAAAIAACTLTDTCPTLAEMTGMGRRMEKLKDNVDKFVKRKIKEYTQEATNAALSSEMVDKRINEINDNVQANMLLVQRIIQSEKEDAFNKLDDKAIVRLAEKITGPKMDEAEARGWFSSFF